MRPILRSLSVLLVFCAWTSTAAGQVRILGYDSTNPNGPPPGAPSPDLAAAEFAVQITPLLLSRGAGLVPNQGITFNSSSWSTAATLNTSLTDYVQWGWSASTAQFNLEDITIQYDRSSTGPAQLAILLSINGGAFQNIFSDSSVQIGDETHTIGLTAFDNVASATFRLFGFSASSTGGTLDIERFNADPEPSRAILVRGFQVAVPEPGCLWLVGLGTTLSLLVRVGRTPV